MEATKRPGTEFPVVREVEIARVRRSLEGIRRSTSSLRWMRKLAEDGLKHLEALRMSIGEGKEYDT